MSKYEEYQKALDSICGRCFKDTEEHKKVLQELVDKNSKLEKIFGDRHICEIKARFNEIECDADKCDNCPLAIGDDMCLKITFEDKWQFQEERDDLKQKLLEQMKTPTLEECIKEWEALGYKVDIANREIEFTHLKSTKYISIDRKSKTYWCPFYLSLEEHQLITKTMKALGWL